MPEATAAPREEIDSSCLTLEEEIDKFHFGEEGTQGDQIIHISNADEETDRHSSVHTPILLITRPDNSSMEEEDEMVLIRRNKILRELMAGRNTEATSKEVPKSKLPPVLPPPPPLPPTDLKLHANLNLKKKRPVQEQEEGEVILQKGTKQQKTVKDPKDKRAISSDNREEHNGADVCIQPQAWSPRLEVDGATIPWNASVRDFQKGHATHIVKALEQPLILPKDMVAVRKMRQQDLFLSLKMDLALVNTLSDILLLSITTFFPSLLFFISFFYSHGVAMLFLCRSPKRSMWPRSG